MISDAAAATAREFHALTSHAPGRPSPGGPMRWDERPLPAKLIQGVDHVDLPGSWPTDAPPGDLVGLARLLFLAAGVSRVRGHGEHALRFRTYPSAGALYPNEVYVVCRDLDGLPAGLYHYEPIHHRLDRLRDGDVRAALGDAAADATVAAAPLSLVVTGIPWRTTWKYGPRGYRHLFWDAGTLLANGIAAAASADADAALVVGFVDDAVSRLLDLGAAPFLELPLAILAVGAAQQPAPAQEAVPLLEHKIEPLSSHVPDEPELTTVHRAGDLDDAAATRDWRRRLAADGRGPAWAPGRTEDVVLARGSTRRFDRLASLPEAVLR
ncbi:MAG: SagB/ThcOx family dehydrogenase, partial [Nitriliruptorales bacterium]